MRVDFDRRNKSSGSLDIHQNEILPEKRLLLTQSGHSTVLMRMLAFRPEPALQLRQGKKI